MSSGPYVCSKCHIGFPSEEALNQHMEQMKDAHDFIHDK